jgi:hypothetical protein
MNFSEWWEQNKVLYEGLGVSKEVAKTIWCSAVDQMEVYLIKMKIKGL